MSLRGESPDKLSLYHVLDVVYETVRIKENLNVKCVLLKPQIFTHSIVRPYLGRVQNDEIVRWGPCSVPDVY